MYNYEVFVVIKPLASRAMIFLTKQKRQLQGEVQDIAKERSEKNKLETIVNRHEKHSFQ